MAMKVTLNLEETVYERAMLLAQVQKQDVAKALAKWLDETLPPAEQGTAQGANSDDDAASKREMQAYISLHPTLMPHYMNQYVAIFGGQLVDHDADYDALLQRIDAAYPNQFVWLTRVEEQPIRQFHFRSPRLTEDS